MQITYLEILKKAKTLHLNCLSYIYAKLCKPRMQMEVYLNVQILGSA